MRNKELFNVIFMFNIRGVGGKVASILRELLGKLCL